MSKIMKCLVTVLLIILVTVLHLSAPVFAEESQNAVSTSEFAGGSGTANDPYLISTKEHLDNVRFYMSAHFKLIDDIEFSDADFAEGGVFCNNGMGWDPIGSSETPFTGIFDGNGYCISGLKISANITESPYVGLFGYNQGFIQNIASISGQITITHASNTVYVGMISGYSKGVIENCKSAGSISVTSTILRATYEPSCAYIGGITGHTIGTLSLCENTCDIQANPSLISYSEMTGYLGGIAGFGSSGMVSNCVNSGSITADTTLVAVGVDGISIFAGGILGKSTCDIKECNNTGSISVEEFTSTPSQYLYAEFYVAGIAGYTTGTIIDSNNSGTAAARGSYAYSGGIAGCNTGTLSRCSNIGNIIATTTVCKGGAYSYGYSGGIAGRSIGTVSESYNTGIVTIAEALASEASFSGGIVAYQVGGTITNCYNAGFLTYKSYYGDTGGIAGYSSGSISHCYNIGRVPHQGGAIVGTTNDITPNCYFLDDNKTGVYAGRDSTIACTKEALLLQETYTGFDFDAVWEIGVYDTYPCATLKNIAHKGIFIDNDLFAGGAGTAYDPFLIENAEQLNNIRVIPAAYYELITDIVFKDSDYAEGGAFYNDGKGWSPIPEFVGSFDGCGHVINNLRINYAPQSPVPYRERVDCFGLFGYNSGTICRVGITGDIYAKMYNSSGTLENIYAGGIAGMSNGTIRECYFIGNVYGSAEQYQHVGGICGWTWVPEGTLENCFSYGTFTCPAPTYHSGWSAVGGIAGSNGPSNCYSIGRVVKNGSSTDIAIVAGSSSTLNCTDAEMRTQSTYADFDFTSVWTMEGKTHYPYPELISVPVCFEQHTVVFQNWDGTVLSTNTYYLGEAIAVPPNPSREADDMYIYTFAGWDRDVEDCTGDTTYTAQYTTRRRDGILYSISHGQVTITEYVGAGGAVTIPATIENLPVTSIAYSAFRYCSSLTSITIPDSVTSIGVYAFYGCSSLTSVNIPDGVTSIGQSTFYGCSSLTSITIPDSVTIIANEAFRSCSSLTSINIPDGVTSIGQYTFCGCSRLSSINIPDSVTSIGQSAFSSCSKLTSINIPSGVTSIAKETFRSCSSLVSITIPDNVTNIGENAFYQCRSLTTVVYCGTQEQWEAMAIQSGNGQLEKAEQQYHNYVEGTCQYCGDVQSYTVVFENWNGDVISINTYHWGDVVTEPANPSRVADQIASYAFAGWDKPVVNCAGNATYTATYTPSYIDYTVVFKNWDGYILSTKTYHWDDEVTVPGTPSKDADNTYTYAFAGWDKPVVNCAGNATYTAVYTSTYIDYTVVFKNWSGTVLSTKTYHWGDKVTAPADPTKPADNTYTYVFAGWDKSVVNCAGNATYTATYAPTYIDYTVVFKDWDGTILSSKTYHWGDEVTTPTEPTKEADNTYVYTFVGWDMNVANCAGSTTYIAVYTSTYIDYTVVFKNWNGTVLSTKTYHWGDSVIAPTNPTRPYDEDYIYTFAGWDKSIVSCNGDAIYTATYNKTAIAITSIAVTTKPTKLTYVEGEPFNQSGMIVTAYYNNNTSKAISGYTISGYTSTVGIKTITVTYEGKTATFTVTVNSKVPSTVTSSAYTISGGNVSKIAVGTSVKSLLSGLNEGSFCKVYNGNTEVSGNTAVGTGMVVKIMDGNTTKASYTIIVTGDTNGDGKISVTDMLAVKAHVLKKNTLSGASAQAADTSGDKAISITDFIQMKAHILGKSNVEPRAVNSSAQQLSTASVEPEASVAAVTTEHTTSAADKTVSTLNYIQVVAVVPDKKSLVTL